MAPRPRLSGTLEPARSEADLYLEGSRVFPVGNGGGGQVSNVDNIAYSRAVAGSKGRSLRAIHQERVSLLEFATGDGVTDDTLGVQAAIDYCATNNRTLFVPENKFVIANVSLRSGLCMMGSDPNAHQFQLKNGANVDMFSSATIDSADDLVLRDLGFDGNKANNPDNGVILHLKGDRPSLYNLLLKDAPRTAMLTENVATGRIYGVEGHFDRITIDAPYGHGWDHQGPNDSTVTSMHVVDPSSGLNGGYYGIVLSGQGSGKFLGSHIWNRATTSIIPRNPGAGLFVQNQGNTFVNCDFECGNVAIIVGPNASLNQFVGCKAYAADGNLIILLQGPLNRYNGAIMNGDTIDATAVQIGDATNGSYGNVIEATTADTKVGDVNFVNSTGNNRVRIVGYRSVASAPTVLGTPHVSDDIEIVHVGVAPASSYRQYRKRRVSFTPVVTSTGGSITGYTATGSYVERDGMLAFNLTITLPNPQTGTGTLTATLPKASVSGISNSFQGLNVEQGAELWGFNSAGTSSAIIAKTGGLYPGGNGQTIVMSGEYPVV